MANPQSAKRSIFLDTTSAQFAVDQLQEKIVRLDKVIADKNANGQSAVAAEKQKTIALQKQADIQAQIAKGLSSTLNQQLRFISDLRGQIKNLSVGTEEWKNKVLELSKAESVLKGMKDRFKDIDSAQKKMSENSSVLTKGGVFMAAAAANVATRIASTVGSFVSGMFAMRIEFEKSLANLSAITGASGKDLETLKKSAIDLSTQGTQSAIEYVEAMKLIASAKPELLESASDLIEVTKAAKLLSDAAGISLPEAATKLTDALNQFGEPAARASVYVDALAAASKFGAAEVPQITEALLQFGTQAKSANIDIYESSAAIELLAEKGIKGAEAGTKLRNVFLALNAVDALDKKALDALAQAGVNTEILKDKTLSLEVRLKEMSKIAGNSTALVQVFGKENFNAGQIILQNIPRYAELTKQVKEQGVAAAQAATNTDTLGTSWQQFQNVLSSKFLDGSNSPVKMFVDSLTLTVEYLDQRLTAVITTLKAGAIAIKENLALGYEFATLDVKGARDRMKRWEENDKAAKASIEQKQKEIEINRYADGLAKIAGKETIESQQKILKAEKGSLELTARKRDELIKSGKQTTEEYKKNEIEFLQHARAILRINKSIADAEKAAGNATDNTIVNGGVGGSVNKSKIDSTKKKLEDDKKRLFQEYEQLRNKVNQDITDLLTPEASKKINAIQKEYTETVAKYYELNKKGAISKQLLDAAELKALERKNIAIKNLLEEEAKSFKPLTESKSTIDVSSLPKQLQDAINSQPPVKVEVPIEILPEIQKEDQAEVAKAMAKVIENIKNDTAAGNKLNVLKAKNPVAKRDAKLQELEDEYADTFTKIEAQRAAIVQGKRLEVDNNLLLAEGEYQAKRKDIVNEAAQEIAAIVSEGLQFAQQVVDVLARFDEARSARENAALNRELKQNEAKKNSIRKLEESKVISSQEAKRRLRLIELEDEKKKEELEKKQRERQKRISIAQAVINGALAITSILAAPTIDPTGILKAVQIGLAIATTAAQIAVITAQKFATGGQVQQLENGKINTASNIPTQPNGDNVLATVKTGEVILNEQQQAALGGAETFRRIGVPGFAGGGVSMKPWHNRPYQRLNYAAIANTSQVIKGYAEGGLVRRIAGATEESAAVMSQTLQSNQVVLNDAMQTLKESNQTNMQLVQALKQLTEQGVEANLSLYKLDQAQDQRRRIKNNSELK